MALKFRRLDYLGPQLGRRLAERLGDELTAASFDAATYDVTIRDTGPVVTAVPLHWRRRWSRGYDQATLVARSLAGALALPYGELLRRRRATAPQSQADRRSRRLNLRRAFVARAPEQIRGARIVLVDDVVTTGATLEAAALCLRRAGAAEISAVAVARTPPPDDPSWGGATARSET